MGATDEKTRAGVEMWGKAGPALEAAHARELRDLTPEQAIAAANALFDLALALPLPEERRLSSGLVEQQALFRRARRP